MNSDCKQESSVNVRVITINQMSTNNTALNYSLNTACFLT